MQAHCEGSRLGIPANNSSDPRNYTNGSANVNNYKPEPDGEFDPSGESNISKWPREVRCYVDSEGNTYDFASGLNWKGQINDRRVKKYYGNSPVPR